MTAALGWETFPTAQSQSLDEPLTVDQQAFLQEFEQHAQQGRWPAALERWQKLRGQSGYIDIPLPLDGYTRRVPLADYLQERLEQIALVAPEFCGLYRGLMGARDRPDLTSPEEQIPPGPSRLSWLDATTPQVGDTLAEDALIRGEWDKARAYWQAISPRLASGGVAPESAAAGWWQPLETEPSQHSAWLKRMEQGEPVDLVPSQFMAEVWSRLVLTSLWQGDVRRAEWELQMLQAWQPTAAGTLGGRSGNLLGLLRDEFARERPLPNRSGQQTGQPGWGTFGGSMEQTNQAATSPNITRHWPVQSTWHSPLVWRANAAEHFSSAEQREQAPATMFERDARPQLPWFPVVTPRGRVVWHDHRRFYVRGLRDGRPLIPFGEEGMTLPDIPGMEHFPQLDQPPILPSLLSVHNELCFATIASPISPQGADHLVAIDLDSPDKPLPGFPWRVPNAQWSYVAAPIVSRENLYYALWKRDTVPELHIVCRERSSGYIRWQRQIAIPPGGHGPTLPSCVLSLRDDNLYINGNVGSINCLNTSTGELRWSLSYPRNTHWDDNRLHAGRYHLPQLSPCLLHREFVFALPFDCEYLFAMDAWDGHVRWSQPIEERWSTAAHLLGVTDDMVILGGTVLRRLDLRTGNPVDVGPDGPTRWPDAAEVAGRGRGCLVGNRILWPVLGASGPEILCVDPLTGHQLHQPFPLGRTSLHPGNLLITDSTLVVATHTEIRAWHSPHPSTDSP